MQIPQKSNGTQEELFFLFITATAATTATTISTSSDNRELTTSYSLF